MKKLITKFLLKLYAPLIRRINDELSTLEKKNNTRLDKLTHQIESLAKEQATIKGIARANHDNTDYLTRELYKLRRTEAYKKAFTDKPLISVRIATYNRSNDLINKAIASVLKQTYENFEIVVVGDHCTDDTEEKIEKLNDKRIRFYNLPNRINYPEDKVRKWRVIGTPAMNMAAEMAKGTWIAPLDDDDEFSPDHLQKLITHAQTTKCELVYGASLRKNLATGEEETIWSFPPERGKFTFFGAIYMKELNKIFKNDFKAWVMEEVNDWNLCRRMIESGVKISAIEDIIGTINHIPPTNSNKDY
jgi:hypothetical protein